MPDLILRGEGNVCERGTRHREAAQSAVPLNFEAETASETRIYACGRRSSAAC